MHSRSDAPAESDAPGPGSDTDALERELVGLFRYLRRVREEIAAIRRPADGDRPFDTMAEQLDAIVAATEDATNTIMAAMESNDEILAGLRNGITDAGQLARLDRIAENGRAVFEACAFQDLTGQRISRVVRSFTYVEDRINALVEIWGREALDRVAVGPAPEKTADEMLLHGPQLAGQGISQDEIDKLFD